MSKNLIYLCSFVLVLSLCLMSSAYAADIIVVNEAHDYDGDGLQDDHQLVEWLVAEGHSVDVRHDQWMTLDADKIEVLNAADLIIISRTCNSTKYDEGDEPTQWNSATTPLILMQALIVRSNRWKWINSSDHIPQGGAPALEVMQPDHPIFANVALGAGNLVQVVDPTIGSGHTSKINANNVGNGILLAKEEGTDMPWIAEWEAGVEFYNGAGQIPADKRMMFFGGTQETDGPPPTPWGAWNFTAEGEIMFRNAISYMLGELVLPLAQASTPKPDDQATDVPQEVALTWRAGAYVEGLSPKHRVFFSENFDDVNDGIGGIEQDVERYPIDGSLSLDLGKTCYWRVDEANSTTGWDVGNVWRFTVSDYLVVDDFESYNDLDPVDPNSNRIFLTWIDGFDDPVNGSLIGYAVPPFAERSIVHGGKQSMPYSYDNAAAANYSEAQRTFSPAQDWTREGVDSLALWFRGYPGYVGSFVEAPAGTYTMTAEGADIWGNSDEFHFAWKELSVAGSIVAKVQSVSDTDPFAKAGVMIRDTLEPGSRHAMVVVTPGNGVAFQYRNNADGTSSTAAQESGISAPQWVKVERTVGGLVRGYYSADGNTWTQLGTPKTVKMNMPMYIGLALTSHNSGVACEAKFSNVSFPGTTVGPQWTDQDIGLLSNEAEPMYVTVEDGSGTAATVYHNDPDAALIDTWTQWNIDTKQFGDAGVVLTDVSKLSIGFGGPDNPQPGGSGLMYFDDIRLYASAPEPEAP